MFGKSLHFKAQSKVNKGVAVLTMFAINVRVPKNEKFMCVYGYVCIYLLHKRRAAPYHEALSLSHVYYNRSS